MTRAIEYPCRAVFISKTDKNIYISFPRSNVEEWRNLIYAMDDYKAVAWVSVQALLSDDTPEAFKATMQWAVDNDTIFEERLQALYEFIVKYPEYDWEMNPTTNEIAKPKKPTPVICFEVWAKPNPNMDYMEAVRAMCRGN